MTERGHHKGEPRGFYDFWALALENGWVGEEIDEHKAETQSYLNFLRFAFEKIAARPVKRILDVACGYGRTAVPLANAGYSILALDSNLSMIQLAKKRASRVAGNAEFRVGDMRHLKFHEEFDTVTANYCLDYLIKDKDLVAALGKILRALRAGGILVAVLENPYHTLRESAMKGSEVMENKGITILGSWRKEFDELTGIVKNKELLAFRVAKNAQIYGPYFDVFRLYNWGQLKLMLEESGFHYIKCFGSFEERRDKGQAKKLVIVARKT